MATSFESGLGITVTQETSTTQLQEPTNGIAAMGGLFRRGVVGEWIPVRSYTTFNKIFGDQNSPDWGLYTSGESSAPDAVKGFYGETGELGFLWVLRVEVPGAKTATGEFKDRQSTAALKVDAANPGRWAGCAKKISKLPVLLATANSFTLDTPDVEGGDFAGATVVFNNGKSYSITSNAKASSNGLTIYQVASDNNLPADGVMGPVVLDGVASYATTATISGTISYAPTATVSGTVTVDPLNPLELTGTGTAFLTKFSEGDSVFFAGEQRTVTSIVSDTQMFIDAGFSSPLSAATISKANLTVTGVATKFTGETVLSKVVSVGTPLTVVVSGTSYTRTVASIASATSLTLSSGFPVTIAGATATVPNHYVEGVGSAYDTQLQVGDLITDPAGLSYEPVEVTEIVDPETFKVSAQFSADFAGVVLSKISATATVELSQAANTGLSFTITPGERYPTTHFGIEVQFNGKSVVTLPDTNLDPTSSLFIEYLAKNTSANVVTDGAGVSSWPAYFSPTSLLAGEYETSSTRDVRPWNGSGSIVGLSATRLYAVADFDYDAVVGNWLYPNLYGPTPKLRYRVNSASSPVAIEGTVNIVASNVAVTGVGTNFLAVFGENYDPVASPAYLYDVASGLARQVQSVADDNSLILAEAFPSSVFGSTRATKKAGYVSVVQGQDLSAVTEVGDVFIVSYPTVLSGGSDGDVAALTPYDYSQYFSVDTAKRHLKVVASQQAEGQGLITFGLPGVTDVSVLSELRGYAETVAYFLIREFPASMTSEMEVEPYLTSSLGPSDNCTQLFPSFAYKKDEKTGVDRLISTMGHRLGRDAVVAREVAGYHAVASGTQNGYGYLKNLSRLPVALSDAQVGVLNKAGVQCLILRNGRPTIWGVNIYSVNESSQVISSARMILNYINVFQENPSILDLIFRPNQPAVDDILRAIFDAFGRSEYSKGAYSRDVDRSNSYGFDIISSQAQGSSAQDQLFALSLLLDGERGGYYWFIPAGLVRKISISIGPKGINAIASQSGLI